MSSCWNKLDQFYLNTIHLDHTRRVPVQRAVERDEIPYPYKVHDTTLRPLLNKTIQKHNYKARGLIIFLGFIKSKPCQSQTIKKLKVLKKMCQLA